MTHLGHSPLGAAHTEHVIEYLQLSHILSLGEEWALRLSKLTPGYRESVQLESG